MRLKIWRFVTIVCTALVMGLTFAHLLESPAKLDYDGPLWVRLQNSLYDWWGVVSAPIEVIGVLGVVSLAWLVRDRKPAFRYTLVAAVSAILAFPVVFFVFVFPVNLDIGEATPASVPENWESLRRRWEYGHAAHFALLLISFIALLLSVLVETPDGD